MLRTQLGLDIVHVPYKGQAPALTDLLGGQVSIMFGNWPEFRSHIEDGKLAALGMATLKRSVYAPNIPTLAEQGVPIESNSWNGLLAPAATPEALSPGGAGSKTVTLNPARARRRAIADPKAPAPATATRASE